MNIKRMKMLEHMLRNEIPEEVSIFDMRDWVQTPQSSVDWAGIESKASRKPLLLPDRDHTCGTAACAFGSAAFYKPFVEQGLHISECGEPSYGLFIGLYAAMAFFDISERQAELLFLPGQYPSNKNITPEMVADRVASMIHAGEV